MKKVFILLVLITYVMDKDLHPYKTTGKIIILAINQLNAQNLVL